MPAKSQYRHFIKLDFIYFFFPPLSFISTKPFRSFQSDEMSPIFSPLPKTIHIATSPFAGAVLSPVQFLLSVHHHSTLSLAHSFTIFHSSWLYLHHRLQIFLQYTYLEYQKVRISLHLSPPTTPSLAFTFSTVLFFHNFHRPSFFLFI